MIRNNPLVGALTTSVGIVSAIAVSLYSFWYVMYKEVENKLFVIIVLLALLTIALITLILIYGKMKECEAKNINIINEHNEKYEELNREHIEVTRNRDALSSVHEGLHRENGILITENLQLRLLWMGRLENSSLISERDMAEVGSILMRRR